MILLEVIPDSPALLSWGFATSDSGPSQTAEIQLSVRVPQCERTDIELTTGEHLAKLCGTLYLKRGTSKDVRDVISYVASSGADDFSPPNDASYVVYLHVTDWLFDGVLSLLQLGKVPTFVLGFNLQTNTQLAYGNAPDASHIVWKNDKLRSAYIDYGYIRHSLLASSTSH